MTQTIEKGQGDRACVPVAGDWVLFHGSSYDKVSVELKQAAKITPSLVKFDGSWPRQCNRISVVAAFADKATAERVRDSINGVAGEFNRRRREAEDERTRRITEALAAANRQVERIVAKATADAPNPEPHT